LVIFSDYLNALNDNLPDDLLFDTGDSNSANSGGVGAIASTSSVVGSLAGGHVVVASSMVNNGGGGVMNGVMNTNSVMMTPQHQAMGVRQTMSSNPNINLVNALQGGNKMTNGPVMQVSLSSRHWKDHFKNDSRSDQDRLLKNDPNHIFLPALVHTYNASLSFALLFLLLLQNTAFSTNFTMLSAYCTIARQPCPAALPGSLARQPCPAALPGSLAWQSCPAVLPGSLARQSCLAVLPGSLAWQSCPAVLPGSFARQPCRNITGCRPAELQAFLRP
jgi:hypothetical protein